MATLLTKLPENLVCSMLSKWLKTTSVPRLDVAYCNHTERGMFLSLLSGYVTTESDLHSIGSKYFAKVSWMNVRNIRGSHFKLTLAPPFNTEHVSTLRTFVTNSAKHIETVKIQRQSSELTIMLQMIAGAGCRLTKLSIWAAEASGLPSEWHAPLSTILNNSAETLSELTIDSSDSWVLSLALGVQLKALQKVTLTIHNDTELTSICAVAPNLREIRLSRPTCSGQGLAAIGQHCPQLEKLSVDGHSTNTVQSIDIGIVEIAEMCPKLKHLSLAWCPNLTDIGMNAVAVHCTQLESLELTGADLITDAPIIALARNSSATFVSLTLDECDSITGDSILAVAKHCTQLHTLILTAMDAVTGTQPLLAIPHLRNIRTLKLHHHALVDPLLALIAEHMHQLEHVKLIPEGPLHFSFDGLLQIVQRCEKLQRLELRYDKAIVSKDKRNMLKQALPELQLIVVHVH